MWRSDTPNWNSISRRRLVRKLDHGRSGDLLYERDVQASMSFYEPYEALPASTYQTGSYFPTYYANPVIAYAPATGLQQIMQQKYVSFFYNSFEEPYFNLRRTGLPVLSLSGGGIQNNGVLPLRFLYPIARGTDLTGASLNVRLFSASSPNAGDNINGVMWILQ